MRGSVFCMTVIGMAGGALAQGPQQSRPETLAAPGRPGWSVDARSGCWLWVANPLPGLAMSWSGACPRGPATGQGTMEWHFSINGQPRVSRYVGSLVEGRMHGPGVYSQDDGYRFEGGFSHGERSGHGVLNYAGGGSYVGAWARGYPEGYGEAYIPSQGWFRGLWRAGCFRREDGVVLGIDRPSSGCR
jgi:hypothetical protein